MPAHLREKDIWVVEVLDALFSASFARELVFKGGTSLAKAYAAVRRFSENVDITRDIRAIAPTWYPLRGNPVTANRLEPDAGNQPVLI